ncbi:docking domain of Afi1 for Arf3 in vesicle trafficking-domain-containing protein [Lasiosphaeria miniovina]|uniref:Docking domain of Afi1 for Arf3 in vesicle trafficking-domain-containing protein n=1 Tax=Lasiosphaeria miniovina TaxID=1954250 RepID=A0AA40AW26_9PEZI|nr:docking domain of Afi1 for Arf3 in vesicle trafficking-domain-containing protein [Lasiosphaeria miniovina]KAK0723100.1 docking domain of Afi1 for Arf3 in vesicle trafficking-domain-containing protein [Lasiosphaeria miniovina]
MAFAHAVLPSVASRTASAPAHAANAARVVGSRSTAASTSTPGVPNQQTSLSSFPLYSRSTSTSDMSQPPRPPRSPLPPAALPSDTDRTSNPSSKGKTASTGTAVSSQHSSLSTGPPRRYDAPTRRPRKLRSQYPRGATENHVEYILVASFDVDRGPVMEHQYPVAITGDEHMLAELMLPDQAHVRNQDWTIFFLHKDTSQEEDDEERRAKDERRRRRRRKRDREKGIIHESDDEDDEAGGDLDDDDDDDDWDDDASTDSEPEGGAGPPLIYVLNLVNTKQDKTVKRGAVVKAMAICTRHPFLHIYKPLLLLALEEYFKSPVPETLSMLFTAVNDMDLSLMPKLSLQERHLLQASDNKDLFVEKFEQMIQMRIAEDRGENVTDQPFDASRSPPKRPGIFRSGTKAHIEGQSTYAVPRDTHEFESKVMYKGIPIPIKVPVAVMPETVGDFSLIKLIQNFSDTHSKTPQTFPLHPHLTTNGPNTHPIIVLVNALLTQKRVIFLGYNLPSGEVADAVLAACALASGGVLRGFTRHAFPYTDLTKIDDLLNVPGFIAGVTNPTFEHHPEWWDLLCDLPSGKMKISSKIDQAPITEGLVYFQQQNPSHASLINSSTNDLTGDVAFMADIQRGIANRAGERVIRAKWRDWVVKFTRIAAAFEESVYGASALYIGSDEHDTTAAGVGGGHGYVWCDESSKAKELAGNVTRIEGWRNTRSYYSFIQVRKRRETSPFPVLWGGLASVIHAAFDPELTEPLHPQDVAQLYTVRPLKGLDLHHMHDRLRTQRLSPMQSRELYSTFAKYVHSYDEICLLLSVAPESHAGLFYVALGLFHKDRDVRIKTADLLERIAEHDAGQHWWKALSRFEKLAYVRIRREAELELRAKLEIGNAGAAGGNNNNTHSGGSNSGHNNHRDAFSNNSLGHPSDPRDKRVS